jgi:hypothetical protein
MCLIHFPFRTWDSAYLLFLLGRIINWLVLLKPASLKLAGHVTLRSMPNPFEGILKLYIGGSASLHFLIKIRLLL